MKASDLAKMVSTKATPQTEAIPGRADQVKNNAGGFVFAVDCWTHLDRCLILGTDSNTYYSSAKQLTFGFAKAMDVCLSVDAKRTVARVIEISESGRAPRNDYAIFALAYATGAGHLAEVAAQDGLNRVCRTATHLFQFVDSVRAFRGKGSGLRKLINGWYARPADAVAFQITKYGQRNGRTHKDVFRQFGSPAPTPEHDALFRWAVLGRDGLGARTVDRSKGKGGVKEYPALDPALLPHVVDVYDAVKGAKDKATLMKLLREEKVPREFLEGSHSQFLNDPEVWALLLPGMPLNALVRNLGKMTSVGLVKPFSEAAKLVAAKLDDAEYVRRSRLHPVNVLMALRVYQAGRGVKGSLSWAPVSQVTEALEGAFYKAFGNVTPTGKRRLIALDISGSMACGHITGTFLTPREMSAALCLVSVKTETAPVQVVGFTSGHGASRSRGYGYNYYLESNGLTLIDFSKATSLADAVAKVSSLPMGGTDCALPFTEALKRGWQVDTFETYTDNETWAGPVHVTQAEADYVKKTGIPVRSAFVAMTATEYSVADPKNPRMMNFVGCDSATPQLISDHLRGGAAAPAASDDEEPGDD